MLFLSVLVAAMNLAVAILLFMAFCGVYAQVRKDQQDDRGRLDLVASNIGKLADATRLLSEKQRESQADYEQLLGNLKELLDVLNASLQRQATAKASKRADVH